MHIGVVIPTYDEAENLPKMVSALFALPLDLELLVVDDASPDGTGRIAEELSQAHPGRISVIHRTGKLGLASAYLQAFPVLIARNVDAIVHMDCDFSHDPAVLIEMQKRIESCDVVFGSRYVPGGSTDPRWSLFRKGLSAWGNFYARTILGLSTHDVTAGFRMWKRQALQTMPLDRVKSNGYVFMVEMTYLASCVGLKICETPIHFADRRWGKSKMSFKIQAEAAIRVWSVLWNNRDLRAKKPA
ncbi:MAG TPA: polyprenol monophosphomannose synthase [Anaerolineales bacterium]|nr:polyprenol monophosphomannose synthase [Anaerolineales bacterium]